MVNSGGVKTEKILIIIVARLAKEGIDLVAVLKRTRGTHDLNSSHASGKRANVLGDHHQFIII